MKLSRAIPETYKAQFPSLGVSECCQIVRERTIRVDMGVNRIMSAIDKPVEETPNEAVSETPPEVAAPSPEGSSADGYDVEFFRQMADKLPSNLMDQGRGRSADHLAWPSPYPYHAPANGRCADKCRI